MTDIILKVRSARGTELVPITGARVTIGRGEDTTLCIEDSGLSRRHASINRDGERLWLLDERSANGSFVNGQKVPPAGTPLNDGDEITMGGETVIIINIVSTAGRTKPHRQRSLFQSPVMAVTLLAVAVLVAALAASRLFSGVAGSDRKASQGGGPSNGSAAEVTVKDPGSDSGEIKSPPAPPGPQQGVTLDLTLANPGQPRLYRDMDAKERLDFIDRGARTITSNISNSNHPEIFDEFVIRKIENEVASYFEHAGRRAGESN
jgi:pSer/pThr/pTyr-binding forkhead associated (FHA) protein